MLSAIREFDDLGQESFLASHGFAEARNFRIVYNGSFYDSKAIVGAAHGYATGDFASSAVFSGGLHTVARCLNRLGFVVDHGEKHTRGGPLWELENTNVFKSGDKSAAYKFVVLLWAISRPSWGLTAFSDVRAELAGLLAPFAVADSAPHPGDPWVALRSSEWWTLEVPEQVESETAGHQKLRALTVKKNLRAGLSDSVQSRLTEPAWKAEAVAVLARRAAQLSSEDRVADLLAELDL